MSKLSRAKVEKLAHDKRPAAKRLVARAAAPEPSGPRLRRAVPILPVLDIGRAIEFYAGQLGFAPGSRFEDHALLSRDDVEILLRRSADPALPKAGGCRVAADDAAALFAEWSALGIVQAAGTPAEFVVIDPDGNVLTFAEAGGL
ncbi:MAG: hypothetical protein HYR74_13005 [Candidatus Eisenbacteria bacterium]|nr:hypothetical protein [Candidatus Eisenbacteria bacterium]